MTACFYKENKMKLTKLERNILNHRLEVPESIAEILDDYHPDDIDYVCSLLLDGKYQEAMDFSIGITTDVLVEAVEGSTAYAALIGNVSDYILKKNALAGRSLAKKVQEFLDYPELIEFPIF
jgi:hypothetical protein